MHYRTRSSAKFRVTLRQTRETSVQSGSGTRIKKSAYKGLLNNRPFTSVDHVTSNKELMDEVFLGNPEQSSSPEVTNRRLTISHCRLLYGAMRRQIVNTMYK